MIKSIANYPKQQFYKKNATSFNGNVPQNTKFIDSILQKKFSKGLFRLAGLNPVLFNVSVLTLVGLVLRPATIMVVPGSNKEDRSYAAGKSIISTSIYTATKLAIFYPFGKYMEYLGTRAKENPVKYKFPHIGTKKFDALNYLINNGLSALITIMTASLMVTLVSKIMNKVVPAKKSPKTNLYMQNNVPDSFRKVISSEKNKIQEGKANEN